MDKTDEILISRAESACRDAEYAVMVTPFCTPRERILIQDRMTAQKSAARMFWYGGYGGAERAMAVFLPDWLVPDSVPEPRSGIAGAFDPARESAFAALLAAEALAPDDVPVDAVQITGSGYTGLGHRDFMGALLSLGIEREVVGDIVLPAPERPQAIVFLHRKITPYVTENLTRIGRDAVRLSVLPPDPCRSLERRYVPVSVVVSSPRADAVVRTLAAVSREDAADRIRAGMVEVNYAPLTEPDRNLRPGDILSIRGCGKFRLTADSAETRRGRTRLVFEKYQ